MPTIDPTCTSGQSDTSTDAATPSSTRTPIEVIYPRETEDHVRDTADISSVSIGRLFLLIFRWLLLLLVALTVEKGIDALAVKITSNHQPFFFNHAMTVSLPIVGNSNNINWSYVCGILATLVIFMLMFRYFLCLIEPITELCRTNGNIDFKSNGWQFSLDSVTRWRIALVIFASTFEFLFLIQASLALPNTEQWLSFLAMLAIFDLCVFIFMPLILWIVAMLALSVITVIHGLLQGGAKTPDEVEGVAGSGRRKWVMFFIGLALISGIVVWLIRIIVGSISPISSLVLWLLIIALVFFALSQKHRGDRRREWLKKRFDRLVVLFEDLSLEWAKLYLGWDVADLVVVGIGLLLISKGYSELVVILFVFILTSVISFLNVRNRRKTFKQHLSVLTLVTEK